LIQRTVLPSNRVPERRVSTGRRSARLWKNLMWVSDAPSAATAAGVLATLNSVVATGCPCSRQVTR
jgi:hypothetical protein